MGPYPAAEVAETLGTEVRGRDKAMQTATAENTTMINFGMGSANAATIMHLLSSVHPRACLFLGKCGGLKRKNQLGDLILPLAAIRGVGISGGRTATCASTEAVFIDSAW